VTVLSERHFADAAEAAHWLASEVVTRLRSAIAMRGAASLVVSGGRSPVGLFQELRRRQLDWRKVWITLADERWVDASSSDSNERLVHEYLLVGHARDARFVPLKNAAPTPAEGLAESAAALGAMPRPFDVVLLGMGEDGHTASLFPGAAGLAAALDPHGTAPLAAIDPPAAAHPRITLTLPALLDAQLICLQIQGEAKRRVYERAKSLPQDGGEVAQLPIAAVLRQTQTPVLVCTIDA
jgi:6-phosphogluconolactonase